MEPPVPHEQLFIVPEKPLSPSSRSRLNEAEKIRQEFIKSKKLLIPPPLKKPE